jgi:hypothetical protein
MGGAASGSAPFLLPGKDTPYQKLLRDFGVRYKLLGLLSASSGILAKSVSLVISVRRYTMAVAAIIASGVLIFLLRRICFIGKLFCKIIRYYVIVY